MAIIKCSECGHDVSTEALSCPHCGAVRPKPWGIGKRLVGGLIILIGASFVFGVAQQEFGPQPPPKTPEQLAKEKKDLEQDALDVARARALRQVMKNPDSFKLVDAVRMSDGTLCVEYRATNSFNAVITEQKAIANDGKIVSWDSKCAGKRGVDRSNYLRSML